MNECLVFDTETDGLCASVIHCVGIFSLTTGQYDQYHGESLVDGLIRLSEASLLVGHWVSEYDCPTIERLTNGLVRFDYKRIVDTAKLSRQLLPAFKNHKLANWGRILAFPKGDFHEFDILTEDMLTYMERDVRLNVKVYQILMSLLDSDQARLAA